MMMLFQGKGFFLFPNASQCPKIEKSRPTIDLFTIRDCWNVNEMQIAFTIGCSQVKPTEGNITVR